MVMTGMLDFQDARSFFDHRKSISKSSRKTVPKSKLRDFIEKSFFSSSPKYLPVFYELRICFYAP
jgi:hypothetical protein